MQNTLTVHELIERLSQLDSSLPVYVKDIDGDWAIAITESFTARNAGCVYEDRGRAIICAQGS